MSDRSLSNPIAFPGEMRAELHGKVPENEPEDLAALPGVPDGGQRERSGTRPEDGTGSDGLVKGGVVLLWIIVNKVLNL